MTHRREQSQSSLPELRAPIRWLLVTAAVLVAASLPLANAEASPRPEGQGKGLSNAFKSTVFLEIERVYHGYELSNTGSGFFISPDGYILTNTHVVADKVEMDIGRETVLVDLTVVTIKVVIAPRTPDELVLPAKVIAIDRTRDLALLKVKYETPHFLEVDLGVDDLVLERCRAPGGGVTAHRQQILGAPRNPVQGTTPAAAGDVVVGLLGLLEGTLCS